MTVETGAIVEDANSYVTVEYADTYFDAIGETSWASLEETKKEQLLIKATEFIDNIFAWYGKKSTQNQSLNFPRTNLVDKDGYTVEGIPECLKKAVCKASLISSDGTELFQTYENNGAVVSETVGQISYTYDVSQKQKDTTLYDSINTLLRGLYVDKSKKKHLVGDIVRV